MRKKIKRTYTQLPIVRGTVNFIKFANLLTKTYKEERKELIDTIYTHGFNDGVEIFTSQYNINVENEIFEKNQMIDNYSQNRFEHIIEKPVYIENYKPTYKELRGKKHNHYETKYGVEFFLYNEMHGYFFAIVNSPTMIKPKIFRGEKSSLVYCKAKEAFNELVLNFQPEKQEADKLSRKRRKSSKNDKIDISHVEKAMGIDPNNNKTSSDDDNIDDILDGLF